MVFECQSSSSNAAVLTQVLTQESRNFLNPKLKAVMEEEQEGYDGSNVDSFVSEEELRPAEDIEMQEGRRQREQELQDLEEGETEDEESEREMLHYEGDTEVEDLFELDEGDTVVSEEEEAVSLAAKKKQKLPVRRGPTTRSHSSVLEEVQPDWKPSSDEEEKGLLKDSEDDGYQPLAFVLPQKRKSRAKKRPPRVWYNEHLEQPHQQLQLHMCFRDQHQFREALLSLHITQARDFKYHRN